MMQIPFIMSSKWTVTDAFKNTVIGNAVASIEKTFALKGKEITSESISSMVLTEIDGKGVYLKRYTGAGKNLRKYIGRSRIRAEWENMLFFHRYEIPAPKVIAYGQTIHWGIMTQGALVTEEATNTLDLVQMIHRQSPRLKDRHWMGNVVSQIADATRKMHQQRFIHTDLKWRNILVTQSDEPEIFMIDCPSGSKTVWPFLERGIIKDLACLDKRAKAHLSRTQRLKFYLQYTGRRLTPADKQRIKCILSFFEGRE